MFDQTIEAARTSVGEWFERRARTDYPHRVRSRSYSACRPPRAAPAPCTVLSPLASAFTLAAARLPSAPATSPGTARRRCGPRANRAASKFALACSPKHKICGADAVIKKLSASRPIVSCMECDLPPRCVATPHKETQHDATSRCGRRLALQHGRELGPGQGRRRGRRNLQSHRRHLRGSNVQAAVRRRAQAWPAARTIFCITEVSPSRCPSTGTPPSRRSANAW